MLTPTRESLLTCLSIERWADDLSGRAYATLLELERTAVAAATPLSTAEIDEAISGGVPEANRPSSADYEERFGRPFVIQAEGRSADAIAGELQRRLTNDDVAELAEVADQLRGIALVRLRAEYAEQFDAS